MTKHEKNVIQWLFEPFTTKVLMHFWTFKEFGYDMKNLKRIHGDIDNLQFAIQKLTMMKLVRMDTNQDGIIKYKYNTDSSIGRAFEQFMMEIVNINLNYFHSQGENVS